MHNLLENRNHSLPLLYSLSALILESGHLKTPRRLFHLFLSYFKQKVCRHCFFCSDEVTIPA